MIVHIFKDLVTDYSLAGMGAFKIDCDFPFLNYLKIIQKRCCQIQCFMAITLKIKTKRRLLVLMKRTAACSRIEDVGAGKACNLVRKGAGCSPEFCRKLLHGSFTLFCFLLRTAQDVPQLLEVVQSAHQLTLHRLHLTLKHLRVMEGVPPVSPAGAHLLLQVLHCIQR